MQGSSQHGPRGGASAPSPDLGVDPKIGPGQTTASSLLLAIRQLRLGNFAETKKVIKNLLNF